MVVFKPVQKLLAMFDSVMARSSFGIDAIFRMPTAIFFGLLAFNVVRSLIAFILQWSTLDIPYKPLRFAAILANALFLFTLLSLTVLRSKPVKSSTTLSARLMAILGTCLPLSLGLLPMAELPPLVTVVSIVMIGTGCGLAIWTAFWLGRSFTTVAVAIVVIHWSFQLKRMELEEQVLGATFPEYADYAAAVPRLIPRF
jgi:protein-S-isoprenylcysteine O-methyltransferase Ste14